MHAISLWEWALLFFLFLMSSFFSATETALFSIGPVKVRQLVEKKVPGSEIVDRLVNRPNNLLATILVGNNIVNIAATAMATSMALRIFGKGGVGIAVAALTIIVLLFGELTPKTYAANNQEKVCLRVARPLSLLQKIFSPLIKLLGSLANLFVMILGGEVKSSQSFVSSEEIKTMVNVGLEEGVIPPQQCRMIDSIFNLNNIRVREMMVPRVDIVGIEAGTSVSRVGELVARTGHSRFPVYLENLDKVLGLIYAKDIIAHDRTNNEDMRVDDLMRECSFVPETKTAGEMIKYFQQRNTHVAIVVDEFGGTAGMVTLEDLLKCIVGDIISESPQAVNDNQISWLSPGEALINARLSISEINHLLDINLPQKDYDTVAGLVLGLLGNVPQKGQAVVFQGLRFIIEETEGNRIRKVRIIKRGN
ncbi:MAG: hemolysin family protein [Bacillota bacterium]